MIIEGKYNFAKVFSSEVEETALVQIKGLCDEKWIAGSNIRIMPDVHAGSGCVIGTTMTITDKVVPNLVGVDIGCGVLVVNVGKVDIDLIKLDEFIRENIPSGMNIRSSIHKNIGMIEERLDKLNCIEIVNYDRMLRSIGTLGGGNHFIEIDVDKDGNKYILIHSGSRNFGKQMCEYYQNLGYDELVRKQNEEKDLMIKRLKLKNYDRMLRFIETLGGGNHFIEIDVDSDGNKYILIHSGSRNFGKQMCEYYQNLGYDELVRKEKEEKDLMIKRLKLKNNFDGIKDCKLGKVEKSLAYLEGNNFDDYIYDMGIAQDYAKLNRKSMMDDILEYLGVDGVDSFETIHNYIEIDKMILRKGSVSAKLGERLVIPLNMEDGSLICIGKGNSDWNYSAPHGAGRVLSRKRAKEALNLSDARDRMNELGIFTTSLNKDTLDESRDAYKKKEIIMESIGDTVEIIDNIKPIYNFKAGE